MKSQTYETFNAAETFALGKTIGEEAESGDVIAMVGDLGGGKTVLAQGIAAGLGVSETVNSPTFMILHEYDSGRLPLFHFDVYRISDVAEMEEIGYREYAFGAGVTLIEWANLIEEILPAECIRIEIEKDLSRGFDYRKIKVMKAASYKGGG